VFWGRLVYNKFCSPMALFNALRAETSPVPATTSAMTSKLSHAEHIMNTSLENTYFNKKDTYFINFQRMVKTKMRLLAACKLFAKEARHSIEAGLGPKPDDVVVFLHRKWGKTDSLKRKYEVQEMEERFNEVGDSPLVALFAYVAAVAHAIPKVRKLLDKDMLVVKSDKLQQRRAVIEHGSRVEDIWTEAGDAVDQFMMGKSNAIETMNRIVETPYVEVTGELHLFYSS